MQSASAYACPPGELSFAGLELLIFGGNRDQQTRQLLSQADLAGEPRLFAAVPLRARWWFAASLLKRHIRKLGQNRHVPQGKRI